MKLHRIRLRNYRGVVDSEVEFAESGVTIVEGPNEVGKTSLPEAMRLAIDYLDSSNNKRIRDIRPVGRNEGPEVEIEISTGPYRLEFWKRWRPSPGATSNGTRLTMTEPQNEKLTGREAHDRLNEILGETLDDNLRKALQIEQGTELSLPTFDIQRLRRALESVAGGEVSDSADDTLMDRIRKEFEEYWTRTGRVTRERSEFGKRVEEAESEVGKLKARLVEIDKDVNELARLEDEAKETIRRLKEQEKREKELSEKWDETEGMRDELTRVETLHEGAELRLQQAYDRWRRRRELREDADGRARELRKLEGEMEKVAPALVEATRYRDETSEALGVAREALRRARETHTIANSDRNFRQDEIDAQTLGTRYDAYLRNQKRLEESVGVIESTKVDERVIHSIEEARDRVVEARAAFQSAAASVEATALSDISFEVNGDKTALAANRTRRVYVEEEVTIVVPDVVRFRVNAAKSGKELVEARRLAEEEYRRLCGSVGVADIEEARREEEARKRAVQVKEAAEESIKDALRDLSPEALRSKIRVAEKNVASYPLTRPKKPPMALDVVEARRVAEAAEEIVRQLEEKTVACEEALRNAEKHLEETNIGDAVLRQRARDALQQCEDATIRLKKARNEEPDEDLAGNLAMERRGVEIVEKELGAVREKLDAADSASVRAMLNNVRATKSRAEGDRQDNERRRSELRGKLDAMGEEGLHTALAEAQGLLEQVRREYEGLEARAASARLLKETFERHQREAYQRYVEPFKQRIEEFGRIVFGPMFEVKVSEELVLERRTLDGVTLEVDQLSTGAREQLGVLSRLACAAIVSPEDGGAPVMIDDALGWSDPQRLQRMGAAIAVAGKKCQIVILTCFPGRYAYVGNAKVVRL